MKLFKSKKLFSRQLALALSITIVVVSAILLIVVTRMIIKDKKAYLYDNLFELNDRSALLLEQFEQSMKFTSIDFISFIKNNQDSVQHINLKNFYPLKKSPIEDIHNVRLIDSANQKSQLIFRNSEIDKNFASKKGYLDFSESFLIKNHSPGPIHGLFLREKEKSLKYVVFIQNDDPSSSFYCIEFMVDKFFTDLFMKMPYSVNLINSKGRNIFSNKPSADAIDGSKLYSMINLQQKKGEVITHAKISELEIEGEDIITGIKPIIKEREKPLYLLSSIKTKKAYTITYVLILKSFAIIGIALGIINIGVIFFTRSLTRPISQLSEFMGKVTEGNYNLTVPDQKFIEFNKLAVSFNLMIQKVNEYHEELLDINKNLESIVDERTQSLKEANLFIKAVIDSVNQGIAVFNKNREFLSTANKSAKILLGEDFQSKNLATVLKVEKPEVIEKWVDNLFKEMIPFDSLVSLGPKQLPFSEEDEDYRVTNLQYFPLRDEGEKIINIVLVATDNTREYKSQKIIQEQTELVLFLSTVAKRSKSFFSFCDQFRKELLLFKESDQSDVGQWLKSFKLVLHSLKGEASFLKIISLTDYVHNLETEISNGPKKPLEYFDTIDHLISLIDHAQDLLQEKLGITRSDTEQKTDRKKMDAFVQYLEKSNQHQIAKKFRSHFYFSSVGEILRENNELITQLATQLNKEIAPIVMLTKPLKLPPHMFSDFFKSLQHLFRNIVDHAIEAPEKREEMGKERVGKITASATLENRDKKYLCISIEDDGAGIDPSLIRQKLIKNGYKETEVNAEDDAKVIYHIFDADFSTRDEVTTTSGRGVGMADIKNEIDKLGGQLIVESKVGKGSKFTFLIPVT